jgi:hypothetical protein
MPSFCHVIVEYGQQIECDAFQKCPPRLLMLLRVLFPIKIHPEHTGDLVINMGILALP